MEGRVVTSMVRNLISSNLKALTNVTYPGAKSGNGSTILEGQEKVGLKT